MMKLLQKITAKDLVNIEGCHLNTAKQELKELREYYKVSKPRFYHYLSYNKINHIEYKSMINQ